MKVGRDARTFLRFSSCHHIKQKRTSSWNSSCNLDRRRFNITLSLAKKPRPKPEVFMASDWFHTHRLFDLVDVSLSQWLKGLNKTRIKWVLTEGWCKLCCNWLTGKVAVCHAHRVTVYSLKFPLIFWPTLLKRFSSKWQKANIFDLRIAQASKRNFAEDHDA